MQIHYVETFYAFRDSAVEIATHAQHLSDAHLVFAADGLHDLAAGELDRCRRAARQAVRWLQIARWTRQQNVSYAHVVRIDNAIAEIENAVIAANAAVEAATRSQT